VALLLAADAGEPTAGAGWLVSEDSVERASLFVDKLYLPSVSHLGGRLAVGVWQRDRQNVLDAIDRNGGRPIARRDLLRSVRLSRSYFDEIVDTLRDEGTIVQATGGSAGPAYRRSP
jgi:hypothetical protein